MLSLGKSEVHSKSHVLPARRGPDAVCRTRIVVIRAAGALPVFLFIELKTTRTGNPEHGGSGYVTAERIFDTRHLVVFFGRTGKCRCRYAATRTRRLRDAQHPPCGSCRKKRSA
jgi:hypothetical protein